MANGVFLHRRRQISGSKTITKRHISYCQIKIKSALFLSNLNFKIALPKNNKKIHTINQAKDNGFLPLKAKETSFEHILAIE